jgi:hypothetical protein
MKGFPKTLHSKVTNSSAKNSNEIIGADVGSVVEGPLLMVASGAVKSIFQETVTGFPSTLPNVSSATTLKVLAPSLRPISTTGVVQLRCGPPLNEQRKLAVGSSALKAKTAFV